MSTAERYNFLAFFCESCHHVRNAIVVLEDGAVADIKAGGPPDVIEDETFYRIPAELLDPQRDKHQWEQAVVRAHFTTKHGGTRRVDIIPLN
jgi:hypothetical protein